jgi:hypothetical protein
VATSHFFSSTLFLKDVKKLSRYTLHALSKSDASDADKGGEDGDGGGGVEVALQDEGRR